MASAPTATPTPETSGRLAKPEAVPTQPSATPELAEEADTAATWTILVYARASSVSADDVETRLDQLEAAGPIDGVQIAVQVGGDDPEETVTGARRYLLAADDTPDEIGSPVVGELGALDMGDTQALADFVSWGIEAYPAHHVALWLWDTLAGWQEATAVAVPNTLSFLELGNGLERALGGGRTLDLVAFGSDQRADLVSLAAVQPYARVAVVTAGLPVDHDLNYGSLLAGMASDPPDSGAALAQAMLQQVPAGAPSAFAHVAAVDLQAVPAVLAALDSLGTALQPEAALVTGAVATARAGAQLIDAGAPLGADRAKMADLGQFAALLAQVSPDLAVAAVATRLHEAVGAAILSSPGEQANPAGGISLAFAPLPDGGESGYRQRLPDSWTTFEDVYYGQSLPDVPAPTLSLLQIAGASGGILQPVFMGFELSGYGISEVRSVAWHLEEGGARLIAADQVLPEPQHLPDGAELYHWRDGVHEDHTIWDTRAPYLSDGEAGEFVVLWPADLCNQFFVVPGEFSPAESSSVQEAFLLFEAGSGASLGMWNQPAGLGGSAPRQLAPLPEDLFSPYIYRRTPDGTLNAGPGATLRVGEAGLQYTLQPLPVGEYQLGFEAASIGGATSDVYAEIAVNNEGFDDSVRAYLDPYVGFQFLLPGEWQTPQSAADELTSASPDGQTRLTVTRHPGEGRRTSELKAQTLELFGGVDLVYEDTRTVGEEPAELVAYAYDAQGGARTGVFLTFIHEGHSYVVDVDGPASAEAETLAVLEQIAASWLWRPLGFERVEGLWRPVKLASFTVPVPIDYEHHRLDNGWELFSHEGRFVAVRRDPATGQSRAMRVQHWLDVANEGVSAFEQSALYNFGLAGRNWVRADFSYERDGRAIRGLVMVAVGEGVESAAWAEAPAEQYAGLVDSVLLPLAAEASGVTEREQLLYQAAFDTAGKWGLGSEDGAVAEVTQGRYRLAVTAEKGFFWTAAGESFGDAIYEVTASQLDGPLDNGYGLLLRADTEAASFYVFEVSGDGYVWIGRCTDGCASQTTLAGDGWFAHPAVQQGLNSTNRLQAIADGEQLRFFVNGALAGEVTDATLARGDVGLFVETLGQGDVVVAFDDVTVYAR